MISWADILTVNKQYCVIYYTVSLYLCVCSCVYVARARVCVLVRVVYVWVTRSFCFLVGDFVNDWVICLYASKDFKYLTISRSVNFSRSDEFCIQFFSPKYIQFLSTTYIHAFMFAMLKRRKIWGNENKSAFRPRVRPEISSGWNRRYLIIDGLS